MPLDALDLPAVLQFVLTALLIAAATVLVVKGVASKYFVVDAGFEAGASTSSSIGGGGGSGEGVCAACGKHGTKKCSRCKRAWYCSQECQSKHWKAGHQHTCKHLKPSDEIQIVSPGNSEFRRRKSSRFSAISLIPARGSCNILKEPKKILFPYDEFVKLFNFDNLGFRPCGLVNCGNSCFANVVLQCLSSTRPLVAYLLEGDHNRECVRRRDGWCFLCELQEHIQRAKQSSNPFSPVNILSKLPNIGGNLGYGRQEDAHEFMRFAIDTMQSICLDEFGGEKALDLSTQETTLIQYIFGGHLRSQVTCTNCNMTSNRYENMMDLTVEIHGDAESLEQCLDQFTKKEWLDGDNKYKCDWCNDYVKACKHLTVHQAPNILTIALKRFQSGRFGKLNKRVSFPENLDLTPYMSCSGDGTDLYALYAVVVHVDMLNASFFGHYICYTKDYYGQWYRIDDCKVTNVEVEDVLSEGAYMLFYSRRSARKEPFVKSMESQTTKQPAEVLRETENAATSSLINVSCIPPNHHDVRLTDTEVSNLGGDTCYDKELSPKNTKLKIVDVPLDERPLHVVRNSEVMDVNHSLPGAVSKEVPILSSCMPGDISTVGSMEIDSDPEISTRTVDAKGCSVNNVDILLEESRSFNGGELSTEPTCMFDSDKPMAESENSELPKESCSTSCSPMEIDSVDGKTSLSLVQNGSNGKAKAPFSRGFLNKPLGKKSLDNSAKTQSRNDSAFHVSQENGYCNGHSDLVEDKQDTHFVIGNGVSLRPDSENGHLGLKKQDILTINRRYDADGVSLVSSGSVSNTYMINLEDNMREGKRLGVKPEAKFGTDDHNNLDLRPQASYCNGASLMGTGHHQFDSGTTLANCNSNNVSNKNGQLKLPFDSNNDNNLRLADKQPHPGCCNEHNGLEKVNGFSVSVQNEENKSRHLENGVH